MSAKKPKFYVVWRGAQPGIYGTWDEASRQVSGYPGAQYKSFATRAEAEAAFNGAYAEHVTHKASFTTRPKPLDALMKLGVDPNGLAVDAACSGVPGPMEYRGVWIGTGEEAFHAGPYADGTNNVGEFLALVRAAEMLAQEGKTDIPIYSDSVNAIGWVRAKTCRTQLARTSRNGPIFALIDDAVEWLKSHRIGNAIRKWETEEWGENPADFGRK
jgi:ribonuclease HI